MAAAPLTDIEPRMAAAIGVRRARLVTLLVVVAVGALTLLRWPTPQAMMVDGDWVHQLAGANQILHGEHPFIDWRTDFGPLRYYPSAAAQALVGTRTLAELLLVSAAYVLAYALLFRLVWRAAGSLSIALVALALALALTPHLFKYYVVLAPLLGVAALWRYIDRPDRGGLLWLAAAVVLSGLFRPDFGAYVGVGGLVALAVTPLPGDSRWRQLLRWSLLLLAWLTPWLLWCAVRGGLGAYLGDTLLTAPRHAVGMALPFPRLDWSAFFDAERNGPFWLYACFYSLPPLAVLLALRCRDATQRRRMLATAALAAAVLGQSMHRAGYSHLLQAIAPCFVLYAWLAGLLRLAWKNGNQAGAVAGAAMLGLASVACISAAVALGGLPREYRGQGWRVWRLHALPRLEMVHRLAVEAPNDPWLCLMTFVADCTEADERIVAMRQAGGAYYFADRRFGGGLPTWSPGFFTTAADQQRWIERARRDGVRLVVGALDEEIDRRSDRRFGNFARLVNDYLTGEFEPVGSCADVPIRAAPGSVTVSAAGAPPQCPLTPRR